MGQKVPIKHEFKAGLMQRQEGLFLISIKFSKKESCIRETTKNIVQLHSQ